IDRQPDALQHDAGSRDLVAPARQRAHGSAVLDAQAFEAARLPSGASVAAIGLVHELDPGGDQVDATVVALRGEGLALAILTHDMLRFRPASGSSSLLGHLAS